MSKSTASSDSLKTGATMSQNLDELLKEIEVLMKSRKWTLGFAESCTGGLLSAALTERPGVSSFYRGGVISYDRHVKNNILKVPMNLIQTHGEVSIPVAVAMARGAKDVLDVDWSVAVTGIAGPSGGSALKPVGTVVFAVGGPSFVRHSQQIIPGSTRREIQNGAVLFALDFLLNAIR